MMVQELADIFRIWYSAMCYVFMYVFIIIVIIVIAFLLCSMLPIRIQRLFKIPILPSDLPIRFQLVLPRFWTPGAIHLLIHTGIFRSRRFIYTPSPTVRHQSPHWQVFLASLDLLHV